MKVRSLVVSMLTLVLGVVNSWGANATITLNPSSRFQTIDGFGAFSTSASPSFMANDLGASISRFSFPSDCYPSKGNFNSAAVNGHISRMNSYKSVGITRWITTIWNPPAWMKDMSRDRNATCWGAYTDCGGHVKPECYPDLANMIVAYCKAIKQGTGVDLYGFSFQNEAAFPEPYGSCVYTPEEYREALKVVGAAMAKEGLTTRLYGAEDMVEAVMTTGRDYARKIYEDAEAKKYLYAVAVHGYIDGVNPISASNVAIAWKRVGNIAVTLMGKKAWMTETSGTPETWAGAMDLAGGIYGALRWGNLSAWTFWMECGSGAASGELEGLLLINCTHSKRSYASKHFYKWIRPDAVRINAAFGGDSANLFAVAFHHPANKTLAIVMLNTGTSSRTVSISGGSCPANLQHFRSSASENCVDLGTVASDNITLTSNSVNTFYATGYEPSVGVIHQTDRAAAARFASPVSLSMPVFDLQGKPMRVKAGTRTNGVMVVKDETGCLVRVRVANGRE